ncbi:MULTISPECIES: phosphatase PAP2 family protein [Arthrobacter]|uniref:Phosphatase PAP2 family protein n=2 Tax=Arthrobacter TaxID=1663 RepID=A0ABU9KKS9_9MICC|nr:phosphatase PAP2 family protein [Arthrobacter sp. YJM1]MDP5227515.1 phosphatase PAP2 family protein [Arthrobacter sp. YJM1]
MAPSSSAGAPGTTRTRGSGWHRSRWRVLALAAGAVLCVLGVALTYLCFVWTATGQSLDASAWSEAAMVLSNLRSHLVRTALSFLPVATLVAGVVLITVVAVAGKRWVPAVWAVAAGVAANAATQVLKSEVFVRPDLGVASPLGNSLPSGHTTLAASAAAAVTLAVAPRWRPFTAMVGGTLAFLSGSATVVNLWHRPADVVSALLVVGAASSLAAIPVVLHGRKRPRPPGGSAPAVLLDRTLWSRVTGALALLGAAAGVVIVLLPAGVLTATVMQTVDTRTFWSAVAFLGSVSYGITWAGIRLLSGGSVEQAAADRPR